LIVSLLVLAISVFVLWVWNQERKTAANKRQIRSHSSGNSPGFLRRARMVPMTARVASSPQNLTFCP
jgi:hypothetical protein